MNLVTVCLPVFERYDFFENAVNSVLNQTVGCQILVCDNASSHNLFQQYCVEKNIRYHRNETNIGLFNNWNRCAELCDTEYFVLLSDDDFLEPDFIESFYKNLKTFSNLDIYYSNFKIYEFSTGEYSHHDHRIPFGYFENTKEILKYGLEFGLSFPVFASVIRKCIFSGFENNFHTSADWLWMYSHTRTLKVYGNSEFKINRGSHTSNDSKNSETAIRCIFAISFIYGKYLNKELKNEGIKFRFLSFVRSLACVVDLYAYNDIDLINKILYNEHNKYNSIVIKYNCIKFLPKIILKIAYKFYFKKYYG